MAKIVDLRTYLLLERAFVRRLQRSWRALSAPTYAAIAQACKDHRWDEARRLVTDLDMTEVGTENREWITYMLLSCAVFGAGMAARKKPSFVGVGSFDTFLKQVTNNFLMYLEHGGTQAVQEEALQAIAEDEAKTKALKFDPHQLRDEKGRWAKGGKAGVLTTDLGNRFLHGTAQGFLDDILRNGIRGSEGGKIHPKDRRNRTLALPGHVYMTTDLEEAKEYAQSAGLSEEFFLKHRETILNPVYAKGYPRVPEYDPSYEAGTEIGGGLPCVITIELPPEVVAKLRKDRRSDILTPSPYAEGGGKRVLSDFARSYKGDIKPEWIKSITYMTKDMATGTETWHTIEAKDWKAPGPTTPPYLPQPPGWEVSPEWQDFLKWKESQKVAAEGTVVYLALKIPVQSVAPGIGGITRKFDAALHPRGDDGRFIEASQPRIFSRYEDVGQYDSWGEKKWGWRATADDVRFGAKLGEVTGRLLTGEPIPRDQIPAKLYHVTTNAPAVEESGVLLGLREHGGLGGGQAEGVSFTSSKEDAHVIQRELRRAVQIARGDVSIEDLTRWAREDEKEAGLPEGSLDKALTYALEGYEGNKFTLDKTFVWDKNLPEEQRGWQPTPPPPEERERIRRSLVKDALNAYLQSREETAARALGQQEWPWSVPILKNPILFGQQEHLAKLKPENIQILETDAEDIPAEALVTTGSDKFLHEVRVYADVPRRRKKVAYDPNQARGAEGTPEGGQFVETGRSGVPTPDPVLAVQAKAGIAAVEKLIPEALKTADFSKVTGSWADLPPETQQKVAKYYEDSKYDDIDIQAIDADLTVDVRWNLKEGASPETAKMVADKTKVWVEGYLGDKPLDEFAKDKSVSGSKPLDFKTLSVPDATKLTDAGYPVLDLNALRHTDGTELTGWEKDHVRGIWKRQYEKVIEDEIEKAQDSDEYLAKREVMVRAEVQKRWERLSDVEKNNLIPEMIAGGEFKGVDNPYGPGGGAREPQHWKTGIEEGTHDDEDYARTHALTRKLTELRTDELRKERGLMELGPKPTFEVVERTDAELAALSVYEGKARYLVKDAAGDVVAAENTRDMAEQAALTWAHQQQQITNPEGLPLVTSEKLIQDIWQQWIRKSSEGLSLSLQLAAARELGGHHRMTPEEVRSAEQTAEAYGGIPHLQAYVRAQWEVTQTVMHKAGQEKISVYRGLMLEGKLVDNTPNVRVAPSGVPISKPTNVKVLVDTTVGGQDIKNKKPWPVRETVTFDFEGEHFTVLKDREPTPDLWEDVDETTKKQMHEAWEKNVDEVVAEHPDDPQYSKLRAMEMFEKMSARGKMQLLHDWRNGGTIPPAPFESTESAINRIVNDTVKKRRDIYTKLPEIVLQRSGAQSTTGTPSVANDWGGVGNLPENPERVVIRIEAPPTSVLSLPVYGENNQEEHESVLLGTKDKWLWDAWRDQAPTFEDNGITGSGARKAEMKKLVIDLQAEDRGKPHWMSSVDWSKVQSVAKFDESKHRRDAQGQFAPFYHGTSNEIAEKILEEGLKPLSEMDRSSPIGKGFASTSEKVALSYAAMASDDSTDTLTVIVFKPEASQFFKPAGKLVPGGGPGTWGHARSTEMSSTETVPPEMIEEVRQYRLADVLEAIGPQGGKQYADWETPLEDLDPVSVVRKKDRIYFAFPTKSEAVVKWDESKHPRDKDGQFTEGVGRGAEAQKPDTGTGGGGGVAVPKTPAKGGRPEAVPEVQAVADAYNAKHGLPPVQHDYAKLDEARAGSIADAYDALPLDDSGNPEVRAAYEALATEIRAQFDHIVASGVTFTPWTKEGQPYQNSAEMVDDIRKNKHMFFYTGGDPNPFMAARDPETGLTTNDMFRAVHDYFGHAAGGYGFGPRGEENAWMSHSQMLTPQARRALTTETRGQNSNVNFGKHNYNADGTYKNIPPAERPFAIQKTALLSDEFVLLPGEDIGAFHTSIEAFGKSKKSQSPGALSNRPSISSKGDSQVHEMGDSQSREVHDSGGETPRQSVGSALHVDGAGHSNSRGVPSAGSNSQSWEQPAEERQSEHRPNQARIGLREGEHSDRVVESQQPQEGRDGGGVGEGAELDALKWDESRHPRDEDGQFTRVAMTSQRPPGDPGHQPNKEVFRHMRVFQDQLEALPGVSKVSVKPGVGGWEGGSESMWQIYYKGNGEARKLVARTAKEFNQDAVLILNKCEGKDCQPAVELSFEDAITPTTREHIHKTLVNNGVGGWTWMKRNGKTLLRMVCVPQWGGEAKAHQQATVEISRKLREDGLKNHRKVHKVAVSVMERDGYDAIIGS